MLGARDPHLHRAHGADVGRGPEQVLPDRPVRVVALRRSSAGSAARRPSRWPRSGRRSRPVPSRASAGAPSGRAPPTPAAPRDRGRRGTGSPQRAPGGSARAGFCRRAAGGKRRGGEECAGDEHGEQNSEAECCHATRPHAYPFSGLDRAHPRQDGTGVPPRRHEGSHRASPEIPPSPAATRSGRLPIASRRDDLCDPAHESRPDRGRTVR